MNLHILEERIGYKFADRSLLIGALTHPSCDLSQAGSQQRRFYQRLEFVGDAVLSMAVVDMLYHRFPEASEGDLALFHTNLVRGQTVAKIAQSINLFDHIKCGKSDLQNAEVSILENSMEALIGAIYLEADYEIAREIVHSLWGNFFTKDASNFVTEKNPKSRLQEYIHSRSMGLPRYNILECSGPDHAPRFVVLVTNGLDEATGEGGNKKKAEEAAALKLLEKLIIKDSGALVK